MGLTSSLDTDAENLLVVITAKRLAPSVRVISKAIEDESEQKMTMVGADGVVMPDFTGGLRMASEMVRPSVVSFLDVMLREKDKAVRIEDVELPPGSPLSGKTLEESGIADIEGAALVAFKDKAKGSYTFNPSRTSVLNEGAILVLMGHVDVVEELRRRAGKSYGGGTFGG